MDKGRRRNQVTRMRHLYALKDAEMKGALAKYLRNAIKSGKSYQQMVDELSAKGTSVGRTTVFDWVGVIKKQQLTK